MPVRLYRGWREPAIQGGYFFGGAGMPHSFLPGRFLSRRGEMAARAVFQEIMDFKDLPAMVPSSYPIRVQHYEADDISTYIARYIPCRSRHQSDHCRLAIQDF